MSYLFFSITAPFASTASGTARMDECHKNSNQKQKMQKKKSKNNPFHALSSRITDKNLPLPHRVTRRSFRRLAPVRENSIPSNPRPIIQQG
jgi:hypothetical protein